MLKIDVNSLLINNKNILVDSESIRELITTLESQYSSLYSKVKEKVSINTSTLSNMVSTELDSKITFLTDLVNEVEQAMDETMDQLIVHNYSQEEYEDKIITYYCDQFFNFNNVPELKDESMNHMKKMENFYNFWPEERSMDTKAASYYEIRKFQERFDYDRFGLDKDKVKKQLLYIYDERGYDVMKTVMYALLNNCPDNYEDYDFHPGRQIETNGHYDYNADTIRNYKTNSEIININGVDFDFAQVLPKDCTDVELLAYNFCKANVINTMRTFPKKYLEAAAEKNRVVVLTCAKDAMDYNKDSWAGYYTPHNWTKPEDGDVVINAFLSFRSNTYYTRDAVIHEFGHKLDDILDGHGKWDTRLNGWQMTDNSKEWGEYYEKYKGVLPDIVDGSYTEQGFEEAGSPKAEFFAEAMVAYFLEPDELEKLCPEVYEAITNLLGEDCCGAYSNGIDDVINTPYEGESKNNGYPEPQPGPAPVPIPEPNN